MYNVNKKSLFRTFIYSKFSFRNLIRYIKDFISFNKKINNKKVNLFPILNEFDPNHEIDYHYTYHPAWALRVLLSYKAEKHIDLASKLDFSMATSSFMPVEYHDYRLVNIKFNNFKSVFTDITDLPFKNDSVTSLSCMHVIEHIGLGRYGDPLSIDGDLVAAKEMNRVLAKNGHLIFVTPVSNEFRIEFNAHRVYSFNNVIEMFQGLKLIEFSIVDDKGDFIENCPPEKLHNQNYACGCFHFIKQ